MNASRTIGLSALLLAFGMLGLAQAQTPPAQQKAPPAGGEEKSINHQTCFCVISKDNLQGQQHQSGACLDLTGTVNLSWSGLTPSFHNRETACSTACTSAAAPSSGSAAIAACACQGGAPNGMHINAYRAVGNTGQYDSAQQIGIIKRVAAVTQTKCPAGWASNTTNVDGGVTTDGKCKKLWGHIIPPPPAPPNGTPVGTGNPPYGFTWGNDIYAWGTTANGGAAVTTVVTPASCGF